MKKQGSVAQSQQPTNDATLKKKAETRPKFMNVSASIVIAAAVAAVPHKGSRKSKGSSSVDTGLTRQYIHAPGNNSDISSMTNRNSGSSSDSRGGSGSGGSNIDSASGTGSGGNTSNTDTTSGSGSGAGGSSDDGDESDKS